MNDNWKPEIKTAVAWKKLKFVFLEYSYTESTLNVYFQGHVWILRIIIIAINNIKIVNWM